MSEMKEFLRENMPPRYQVRFTLERRAQSAVIAGEIVMCDGVGDIIEKSERLYLSPRELFQAVEDMNHLRPKREEFFAALKVVLDKKAFLP